MVVDTNKYENMVAAIAYEFSRKFHMCDADDIRQELWVWFLEHPNKVKAWEKLDDKQSVKLIARSLRNAAKDGSQIAVAAAAIKGTFKAALESLQDPVVYMKLLVEGFKELYHIGAEFSKETYEIAKNQLVTSEQAHRSAEEMKELALHSKEALGYQKNFVEATSALNDSFGTSADFTGKTLEDFTNLTKKLG